MSILFTPHQVAKLYGITTKTLANWRQRRIGPQFCRLPGGDIRYPEPEIVRHQEQISVIQDAILKQRNRQR